MLLQWRALNTRDLLKACFGGFGGSRRMLRAFEQLDMRYYKPNLRAPLRNSAFCRLFDILAPPTHTHHRERETQLVPFTPWCMYMRISVYSNLIFQARVAPTSGGSIAISQTRLAFCLLRCLCGLFGEVIPYAFCVVVRKKKTSMNCGKYDPEGPPWSQIWYMLNSQRSGWGWTKF